jgi:hypothetical protein
MGNYNTHELLSISLIGSEEESPIFIPVETTTEEALDIMIRPSKG